MTNSTVQSFVDRYLADAQAVAAQTGLSPDFILGVAGQESGWGQHFVGNNLFGITGGTYQTPDDSFNAFGSLIANSPNYAGVIAAGGDPQAEATALGQSPYNPAGATYGQAVGQTTQMVSNVTGGLQGTGQAIGTTGTGATGTTAPTVGQSNLSGGVLSGSWWAEMGTRAALAVIGLALILGGVYLMGRRVSI